ncbi:uncharacterized protein LOC144446362 [Glandiceps talaboti]
MYNVCHFVLHRDQCITKFFSTNSHQDDAIDSQIRPSTPETEIRGGIQRNLTPKSHVQGMNRSPRSKGPGYLMPTSPGLMRNIRDVMKNASPSKPADSRVEQHCTDLQHRKGVQVDTREVEIIEQTESWHDFSTAAVEGEVKSTRMDIENDSRVETSPHLIDTRISREVINKASMKSDGNVIPVLVTSRDHVHKTRQLNECTIPDDKCSPAENEQSVNDNNSQHLYGHTVHDKSQLGIPGEVKAFSQLFPAPNQNSQLAPVANQIRPLLPSHNLPYSVPNQSRQALPVANQNSQLSPIDGQSSSVFPVANHINKPTPAPSQSGPVHVFPVANQPSSTIRPLLPIASQNTKLSPVANQSSSLLVGNQNTQQSVVTNQNRPTFPVTNQNSQLSPVTIQSRPTVSLATQNSQLSSVNDQTVANKPFTSYDQQPMECDQTDSHHSTLIKTDSWDLYNCWDNLDFQARDTEEIEIPSMEQENDFTKKTTESNQTPQKCTRPQSTYASRDSHSLVTFHSKKDGFSCLSLDKDMKMSSPGKHRMKHRHPSDTEKRKQNYKKQPSYSELLELAAKNTLPKPEKPRRHSDDVIVKGKNVTHGVVVKEKMLQHNIEQSKEKNTSSREKTVSSAVTGKISPLPVVALNKVPNISPVRITPDWLRNFEKTAQDLRDATSKNSHKNTKRKMNFVIQDLPSTSLSSKRNKAHLNLKIPTATKQDLKSRIRMSPLARDKLRVIKSHGHDSKRKVRGLPHTEVDSSKDCRKSQNSGANIKHLNLQISEKNRKMLQASIQALPIKEKITLDKISLVGDDLCIQHDEVGDKSGSKVASDQESVDSTDQKSSQFGVISLFQELTTSCDSTTNSPADDRPSSSESKDLKSRDKKKPIATSPRINFARLKEILLPKRINEDTVDMSGDKSTICNESEENTATLDEDFFPMETEILNDLDEIRLPGGDNDVDKNNTGEVGLCTENLQTCDVVRMESETMDDVALQDVFSRECEKHKEMTNSTEYTNSQIDMETIDGGNMLATKDAGMCVILETEKSIQGTDVNATKEISTVNNKALTSSAGTLQTGDLEEDMSQDGTIINCFEDDDITLNYNSDDSDDEMYMNTPPALQDDYTAVSSNHEESDSCSMPILKRYDEESSATERPTSPLKVEKFRHSIDKILARNLQAQKDAEIAEIQASLKQSIYEGGFAKLMEYSDEDSDEELLQEHKNQIDKFSLAKDPIADFHPGETIFKNEQIGQLFSFPNHLSLASCGFKANQTALEQLLSKSSPDDLLEIVLGGTLEDIYIYKPCPNSLLLWLFNLMSSHQSEYVSDRIYQILWSLINTLSCKPNGDHLWTPTLKDVLRVLCNYGTTVRQLLPSQVLQSDIDTISDEDLRCNDDKENLQKNSTEQNDTTRPHRKLSEFPARNMINCIKLLTHAIATKTLKKKLGGYSDEELLTLLYLICRIALESQIKYLAVQIHFNMCIAVLLECIKEEEWEKKSQSVCQLLSKAADDSVANHHHNMVYLVQLMPTNTTRGRYLKRRLGFAMLNCLLSGRNNNIQLESLDYAKFRIRDLHPLVQLCKPNSDTDYYQLNSLIMLIDMSVGNEQLPASERDDLEKLEQKLRSVSGDIKESVRSLHRTKVKDLLVRICSKLTFMAQGMTQTSLYTFYKSDKTVDLTGEVSNNNNHTTKVMVAQQQELKE